MPRSYRIDPTFCPVKRRLAWDKYDKLKAKYPNYLNYPLLPPANRFITQSYFTSTLKHAIEVFKGVPHLACRMMVKIDHFLLLTVCTFSTQLPHNLPWEILLEGQESLTFDLNKTPTRAQIMGIYTRCQFLPSYHMKTFEEIFVTGFFDTGLSIFGPHVQNPTLRYVAFKDVEEKDPVHQGILQEEERHCKEEE